MNNNGQHYNMAKVYKTTRCTQRLTVAHRDIPLTAYQWLLICYIISSPASIESGNLFACALHSNHWRSQDFWLGGPVNFHHWLHLPWTTLVTVRVANNRHWKYGTHKTERQRRDDRGAIGAWSGEGFSLCPSPGNLSNFCLEIACYSAFWKQFFRLDSSLFTDQIVTLTQRQMS